MKFKIIGVNDNKLLIALKKLTNAFISDNEFVLNDAEYNVYICLIKYDKHVKIIIKSNDMIFEETQNVISNIDYDLKYALLCCYYKLLNKITNKDLVWGVLTGIRPTKLVHKYIKENFSEVEIISILTSKYLISKEKALLLFEVATNQRRALINFDSLYQDVSIYINIPFCLSRCSYCSFTSYSINNKFVSVDEYLEKLFIEINETGKYLKTNNIKITSVYVGGGTPTSLNEKQLNSLLEVIENNLVFNNILEYTLECGRPDSLNIDKLNIIKKYSVTRISINPQTFNEDTLKTICREHTIYDLLDKYNQARLLNFNNINMDLIIGLPDEGFNDVKNSINETIKLNPESITIHTLALKRGSDLFDSNLNNKNNIIDAFKYTQEVVSKYYIPYYLYRQKNITGNLENIGYAKKGYEGIYNIIMIEELQNIIGLGCGSSSKYLNHEIILNPKDLISYNKSYLEYLNKKLELLNKCLVKVEEAIDE